MKDILILIALLAGSLFILIAAIGLMRFRDTLSRMHATTKATSFGLLLILLGVALYNASAIVWIKALIIIIFIYLTAPVAAHAVSRAIGTKTKKQ